MSLNHQKPNWLKTLLSRVKLDVVIAKILQPFRQPQIQTRLTALILVTTIPVLIILAVFISSWARIRFEEKANEDLRQNNEALAANLSTWLDQNVRALQQMALLPEMVYMRAGQQQAVLQAVATTHPYMYLVSTTDLTGMNVARNDDAKLADYKDRLWFQGAKGGAPLTFQSLIGRTSGKPALAVSTPIRDNSGKIVGVGMFAADLTDLSEQMRVNTFGQTGYSFVVDADNMILGHPDPAYTDKELQHYDLFPLAARQGESGLTTFTDKDGVRWRAYITTLDNGWGIITQQQEAEILAPLSQFQNISIFLIAIAAILTFFLARLMIRRTLQPVSVLTNTASAIAAGDLNRVAEVKNQDEIGALAIAFNTMTSRLRDMIGTLESRVAERTSSLILATDVGRSVSQVREIHSMLQDAVELIRQRFNLYYVQVYLTNPAQTALLLQAGTGEVGAELVGRGHGLPLDTGSLNGRAAVEKRSVVISDTTASTSFRPNPLLPNTRSEMAVPLMAGETVLGVLDLQSDQPETLDQDILPAFEALAGQLTSAIQNANLLAQTEQARLELEAQSRRLVRQSWKEHLDGIHQPEQTGFVFENNQVVPLAEATNIDIPDKVNAITAPIAVTGEAVGALVVELAAPQQSTQNTELISIVARQVAQQIENLRLLESAERYRSEAEAAARQSTIEGWQQYIASRHESLGYFYDTKEVQPLSQSQPSSESAMTLPVKAGEATVGRVAVIDMDAGDREAIDLASAVADRLGAHIENLRLLEETKRSQMELNKRASQLAAVAEISYISARELDIQKLLHAVVHLTQRKFGLYHAHVFIYDERINELRIAACGWKEGDLHEGTDGTAHIPLDQEQSLVARAARTRQPVIVNDVHNEPGWLPNPLLPDTASEMAIPLFIGDQILGVMDVQSDQLRAFTAEDASIQATLASQVATAVQNARSFAQAQQQAERESTLNIINQKIQSATSVEAVLQIAARELGHALGAPLTIAQLGMKERSGDGSDNR